MLTPLIFLGLFLSCLGEESSTAHPVSSTTSPSRSALEKDAPRNPQTVNPRPLRNYAQPNAGDDQGSHENQPRVATTSSQPRRASALNSPVELGNPFPSNIPNKAGLAPNEPTLRSLPISSRSQQPRQVDPTQVSGQSNYRYLPQVAPRQGDPQQGYGPAEYYHPETALRQADPTQGSTSQQGYRYRPETALRQAVPSQESDQPEYRHRPETALRQVDPLQRSSQPEYRIRPEIALRQADPSQRSGQREYRHRPETALRQVDPLQRSGQPEYRTRPETTLRQADPSQQSGQPEYRHQPETPVRRADPLQRSGQPEYRHQPETPVRQAEPSQGSHQPETLFRQADPSQRSGQPDYRYRHETIATQPRGIPSSAQTGYQSRQPSIPDDISYKPYSFNYVSEAEDGYYSHQQSADDSGKVIGSYSFVLDDGRKRVVEYIADQNGFRANIDTNEPGTSNEINPADIVYYSSGPISTRPVSRSYDTPVRRDGSSNSQGTGAPIYPVRTVPVRRPEVVTYHGFNSEPGNAVTGYQISEIESRPVRPAIQNYQGQITRESGVPSTQGSGPESRAPGADNYQPLNIERGPAFTSFLGSRADARDPAYNSYGGPVESSSRSDTGNRGPELSSRQPTGASTDSTRSERGYESLDSQPTGQEQSSQPQYSSPRYQPLNHEETVPIPDYHNVHPAKNFYYPDNGNYWYRRN